MMESVREHLPITLSAKLISEFCQRWHIRKLSLFGSVLREDFKPSSDIDVLVEFEPQSAPNYLQLYQMEQELQMLFHGRMIDLVLTKYLNRHLRDGILASAEVIYEQG